MILPWRKAFIFSMELMSVKSSVTMDSNICSYCSHWRRRGWLISTLLLLELYYASPPFLDLCDSRAAPVGGLNALQLISSMTREKKTLFYGLHYSMLNPSGCFKYIFFLVVSDFLICNLVSTLYTYREKDGIRKD